MCNEDQQYWVRSIRCTSASPFSVFYQPFRLGNFHPVETHQDLFKKDTLIIIFLLFCCCFNRFSGKLPKICLKKYISDFLSWNFQIKKTKTNKNVWKLFVQNQLKSLNFKISTFYLVKKWFVQNVPGEKFSERTSVNFDIFERSFVHTRKSITSSVYCYEILCNASFW